MPQYSWSWQWIQRDSFYESLGNLITIPWNGIRERKLTALEGGPYRILNQVVILWIAVRTVAFQRMIQKSIQRILRGVASGQCNIGQRFGALGSKCLKLVVFS